MKTYIPLKKYLRVLLPVLTMTVLIGWPPRNAYAETVVTVTEVPALPVATPAEITAQELELKTKQLEYEKAKLEQQQSAALDLQKTDLQLQIQKLELLKARRDLFIQETKEQLAMQVQGDVLFDVNSAVLKLGAMPSLRQVALILSQYPKGQVVVTGFADSTGTAQANVELSRQRAESVKTFLLDKSGGMVSSERVIAQGLGEAKPVATNMSAVGRQLNRRVEITISKPLAS